MTRTLVLLRHGRTAWNHSGRVQGQLDVELDETGHAQAARTAPALAGLHPVRLWCSDLARARQTASYVAEVAGLVAEPDPRLREVFLGERQGLTHADYAARAPEEFAAFRRGYYDAVPGAEQTEEVRTRMLAGCTDALASLAPGETGVLVSHGAALRIVVGALLGWPDQQYRSLRGLENCGWVEVGEHPEDGGLRLAAYNRTVPA